ncbi:MAG TPA: diguanylate cyclase [Sphingopyxis sp.]|nr:diguanylate cyclase [Sphingopyxis sp.]
MTFNLGPARATLHSILAQFHFYITLLAVTLAWLAIMIAGIIVLRSYGSQNLELAAQLASYGAEPGLVFVDPEAIQEAVRPLLDNDGVARLRISDSAGKALMDAMSEKPDPSPRMTQLIMPAPAVASIYHNGISIGQVKVWADSSSIIAFARIGFLAGLGCLAITIVGTLILRRRLERDLIQPLSAMTDVVHDVRLHRRFDQRIKPVDIAELDRLGSDINALFDELHGWQGHIEDERALWTHRAMHDTLTSLPNRAAFDEQLTARIERAEKRSSSFALIFIDADNFKQANDAYGHMIGDQVLMVLAERIKSALRKDDFAARLGGDEFVIIFDPVSETAPIEDFVERLRKRIETPISLATHGLYSASVSIGMANYPKDGLAAEDILTAADAAMYADKFRHRNLKQGLGGFLE